MKRSRVREDKGGRITCSIPPCIEQFESYLDYELHCITVHNHECLQCHKKFPTNQFLEIHIDENHNPFWQIARDKGESVYSCFRYGDGCKEKCMDRSKRRTHMINEHGYPRDYDFGIVDHGI